MTFKEMNFKEKTEHIWEYYKLHIGGGIAALAIIGSLLNIYIFNPAPDIALDITVRIGQFYFDETYAETIEDELIDLLIEDQKHETVAVELLQTDENMDPQMGMAIEAKFMGKAEVNELDLLVVGKDLFEYMAQEGYFVELSQVEAATGIQFPEELKITTVDEASSEEKKFGLDARMLPGLAPMFVNDDEAVYRVGIFIKSDDLDNAAEALMYLNEE